MYNGNRQVLAMAFSTADYGTIAFIGKLIVVKLKFPDIILRPISFNISLPTDLIVETISLVRHYFPPSSFAFGALARSLILYNGCQFSATYKISYLSIC